MTLEQFTSTLKEESPPPDITGSLAAMWYEARGDWEEAHNIAQDLPTREGSRVHAYLHRKEGDSWNANYWYNRAGETMPNTSLDEEWKDMVRSFLGSLRSL